MTRFLLAALLLAGTIPASPWTLSAESPESRQGLLERELAGLQAELDLVRGKFFYLKLDARRGRLSLMLQGVTLEEHPIDSLDTGVPEILFRNRRPPSDWDLRSYGGGPLEPARVRDRVEIVVPAPSATGDEASLEPSPPPLPPTAEEAYSVPSRYRILFGEGPTLEVVSTEGGRNRSLFKRAGDAVALRISDLVGAFRARDAGRVRLRVRLSAEDAARLYRALPPDVALLVVGLAPY